MLWVSFLHFFLCVLTGFGIVRYDHDVSRYHKGVYGRKHREVRDLVAALDATEILIVAVRFQLHFLSPQIILGIFDLFLLLLIIHNVFLDIGDNHVL